MLDKIKPPLSLALLPFLLFGCAHVPELRSLRTERVVDGNGKPVRFDSYYIDRKGRKVLHGTQYDLRGNSVQVPFKDFRHGKCIKEGIAVILE